MTSVDLIGFIFDKGLLVGIGTAITYLVKYYFDNVHQRISDIQKSNDLKFADLAHRVSSMEGKYRDVLDIILEKFSKWEDRILGIINKIGTVSPEEVRNEVGKFKKEAQDDINTIKLRVERVSTEVQKIASEPVTETQKSYVETKIKKEKEDLEQKLKVIEDNLNKVIKSLLKINEKQKDHDFKIMNLVAARKVLISDKNEKK
jgi:hypothetical protein